MRDPNRIYKFCNELAAIWAKVPDWRFGQLISNISGSYDKDIFFPEDDEFLQFMKDYIEKVT